MNTPTGTREDALQRGMALLSKAPRLALEQANAMLGVASDDPDAHRLAAAALRWLGRVDEAASAEHRALMCWQSTPALREAARALTEARNHDAEKLLRDRLALAPDDGSAKMMLADIAVTTGFLDEAERLLREVLDRAPDFVPAREELAKLLSEQARFTESLEQYEKLLAGNPSHRGWHQHRITVLTHLGRYQAALDHVAPLLEKDPDDRSALLAKGNILKTLGSDEIEATYRRIIRKSPNFGEAWWSIANLKHVQFSNEDIATMEAELTHKLAPVSRTNLLFALATAKEKRGEYGDAFTRYSEANASWLEQNAYSPEPTSGKIDHFIDAIDAGWLEALTTGGCLSHEPIFIIGMPRAGSTLTEQILASHSAIEGTAELPYIPAISRHTGYARSANDKATAVQLAELGEERRLELGETYLRQARLHRSEMLPHFIDKTPNNWFFLPLIRAILPNAKIIDVRREPMACCFANFKQHFARGQLFTYSLEHVGRYYRDYVRLMDHFDQVAPGYIHHLSYEALVAQPEREIRALLDYLGLEFEEACLKFHENRRAVRTASAMQVRRPLDTTTNEAWRNFSSWLGPLRDALGDLATE